MNNQTYAHPEAGRNDHIHGDEHLTGNYDYKVLVKVTRTILVRVSALSSTVALSQVKDAFEDCEFEDFITDAENDDVVYELKSV
jgi:hypothetical protein